MSTEEQVGPQGDGQRGGEQVASPEIETADGMAGSGEAAGSAGGGNVELLKALSEAAESKDKYLRLAAEFENYKKRTMKERSELIRYQGESIVVELLEVLDGFERALSHADSDPAAVIGGIKMIHKQFVDSLARFEIRAESSVGKQFDPNRQRAIGTEKREGVAANEVITELKKGYLYRDKLVRLGEVVVANGES